MHLQNSFMNMEERLLFSLDVEAKDDIKDDEDDQ
jgi:hypothetical protein